jgi:BlaI family transcriptional regulator, penicillinase repressor
LAMPKHENRPRILPTRAEQQLLDILWRLGEGTVEEIVSASPEKPLPNYKTVQTLLRVMESKGLISHRKQGRAFVFQPQVKREQMSRLSVRTLVDRFFGGSPTNLLLNVLEDKSISAADLSRVEEALQAHRKGRNKIHA